MDDRLTRRLELQNTAIAGFLETVTDRGRKIQGP
jgi:hypothetical protein